MEGQGNGEIRASQGTNTDPNSVPSLGNNPSRAAVSNMNREAALRVLAEDVLSEREPAQDGDMLANFVKGMFNQDWQTLREKMGDQLTEAQLTRVTKKTLQAMSDLVLSLVPTMLSSLPPQSQSRSTIATKSVRFASPLLLDTEQFIDASVDEVMWIVSSCFALSRDDTGAERGSDSGKILNSLASKVRRFTYPILEEDPQLTWTEEECDSDSTNGEGCFFCVFFNSKKSNCAHKIKSCFKKKKKADSLVVCPQKVSQELSEEACVNWSRQELKEFLNRRQAALSSHTLHSEAAVDTVASELLATVLDSTYELCEPHTMKNKKISEEELDRKAVDLKHSLNVILRSYFTQTDSRIERGYRNELISSLESANVLPKGKLWLFSKLLTDRVYKKYCQQLDDELKCTSNARPTKITPSKEVYGFVTEAVTRLLKSIRLPPPGARRVDIFSRTTSARL